jgi:mannose-6-phosphate isomerase
MQPYPLVFTPIYKERLWGGQGLRTFLKKDIPDGHIGESWELSGVEGSVSVVSNGFYQGVSLNEMIQEFGAELLGQPTIDRFGRAFPILIKFLDARLDLSIQVHPSDELARERHQSFGKNEMWYILHVASNAKLIVGFKQGVDQETYLKALEEKRLTDILEYHQVKPNDAFLIETGTIHAIGAGIVLAEIQQTSDVTYRVYDFDRIDAAGNKRELHTELAKDALNYGHKTSYKLTSTKDLEQSPLSTLAQTPYFSTNELYLEGTFTRDLAAFDHFLIYIVVEGKAVFKTAELPDFAADAPVGTTVLIPACCKKLRIHTNSCRLLEVFV